MKKCLSIVLLVATSILSLLYFSKTAEAEDITFPFPKGSVRVTNGYGGGATHSGYSSAYSIDLRTYEGTNACDSYGAPILASQSGTVLLVKNAEEDGEYGTLVVLNIEGGKQAWYAHMIYQSIAVEKGDEVKKGQILGLMGDTGFTKGLECTAFGRVNIGAHLHFEMRDVDQSAYKPEPMVGKERYTDLSKAGSPYYSTSIMYDPSNHWDLYKAKVPYRLTYNPAQVETFTPLIVKADERSNFSFTGSSLPDDIRMNIPGCDDLRWVSRGDKEQKFSCIISSEWIGKEITDGKIASSSYGNISFSFSIKVISPASEFPAPKGKEVVHDKKRPGELRTFTIRGENLPGDLIFDFPDCSDQDFVVRTPSRQQVRCRVPRRVTDAKGKRINDLHTFKISFQDPSTSFSYQTTIQENYRIRISEVSPATGTYGQINTFSFRGTNVDLADAYFIERCGESQITYRSLYEVKLQCVPLVREDFLNKFVPTVLKQRLHYVVVKDIPGGEKLKEGSILMQLADDITVRSVIPKRPILFQENQFEIYGTNLPNNLLVWVENCDAKKLFPKRPGEDFLRFSCNPSLKTGTYLQEIDAITPKIRGLSGPLAVRPDLSEIEKVFKKQERIVDVKLPHEISDKPKDEPAIPLYRSLLTPVTLEYSLGLENLELIFSSDSGGANPDQDADQKEEQDMERSVTDENEPLGIYKVQFSPEMVDRIINPKLTLSVYAWADGGIQSVSAFFSHQEQSYKTASKVSTSARREENGKEVHEISFTISDKVPAGFWDLTVNVTSKEGETISLSGEELNQWELEVR